GLAILREIRRKPESPRVLMLTMHTERAYADEAIAAGADGYLLKSSGAAELRFAVAEAMAGRRYVTPLLRPESEAGEWRSGDSARRSGGSAAEGDDEADKEDMRPRALLATLTDRQREVLQLLAAGHSTAETGALLGITPKTVEFHRSSIRQHLG